MADQTDLLAELQQQVQQLNSILSNLTTAFSQLSKNQQSLSTQSSDTSKSLKSLSSQADDTTKNLKSFGTQSNDTTKNLKSLGSQSDDTGKSFKGLIDNIKSAADSIKQITDGITTNLKSINTSNQAFEQNKSSSVVPKNADSSSEQNVRDSTPLTAVNPNRIEVPTHFGPNELKANELNPGVPISDRILSAHSKNDSKEEFRLKQIQLDAEKQQAIDAAKSQRASVLQVEEEFKQKQKDLDKARLDAQIASEQKYVDTVNKYSEALSTIFAKNTIAAKAAFRAHQAAAAGQVIIDTQKSIMNIWATDTSIPIVGIPKAIAETAIAVATGASSLATIIKQKPGFAQGGRFMSDGRGALLSGYSRTDDTNAYLRSGEAVVVSEAMRNPWARNLVSAINVAHGGRDFSTTNPGRGYAIGGIFTDGGNANRYYSQPANDQKDLANTLAYQMINNFPPIYVDVKDVNNQQNILAQTVNRVNL